MTFLVCIRKKKQVWLAGLGLLIWVWSNPLCIPVKGHSVELLLQQRTLTELKVSSEICKLLYVISRAVRRVKFETILECHEWYLICQISRTNPARFCKNNDFMEI